MSPARFSCGVLAAILLAASSAVAQEAPKKDPHLVHQLGWIMPTTISNEHVTIGFYGLTYSLRFRAPYDSSRSPLVGNEWGVETRILSSYRTHSGITTTFSLSPVSQVRKKDLDFTFPSFIGALLPEVGYVLVSPKETGGKFHDELYIRHLARFQYLLAKRFIALEVAPYIQLSIPFDVGDKRLEGGFLLGISAQLPPGIDD